MRISQFGLGLILTSLALALFLLAFDRVSVDDIDSSRSESRGGERFGLLHSTGASAPVQAVEIRSDSPPVLLKLTGWQAVANIPVDALMEAAANSTNPDDNSIALKVAVLCSVVKMHDEPGLEDWVNMYEGQREKAERMFREKSNALAALRSYCADSAIPDKLQFVKSRVKISGNLAQKVRSEPKGGRADDEYGAALMQVLSNPTKYSVAFDSWLSWVATKRIPMLQGLGLDQRALLRDEIYHRMTGFKPDPQSLRSLELCAVQHVCAGTLDLDDAKRQQVLRVADWLETLLKQQRWQELFGPAGG